VTPDIVHCGGFFLAAAFRIRRSANGGALHRIACFHAELTALG
jgi:hypothetical protein